MERAEHAVAGGASASSGSGGLDDGRGLEEMLQVRADLSAVYIGAIRSKVELLDEINSAVASPANTA